MRRVVLLAVLAAGCGQKPAEPTAGDEPAPAPRVVRAEPTRKAELLAEPTRRAPATKQEPPVGPVPWGTVLTAYKDNEVAADLKYRGKRVVVDLAPITHIGRNSAGLPYLGTENFNYASDPNGIFIFAADQREGIAALKVRQREAVRFEGTCEGKSEDGIPRGRLKGWEWHVKFRDCRLAR
jgi:hypothetical protein